MPLVDVTAAKLRFITGQIAENGALDIGGQTREVLELIERLLLHMAARPEHVMSMHLYLTSVSDYAQMNAVWDDCVEQGRTPARATVGAPN